MSALDALYEQFPTLTPENHRITSSPTDAYNCVAWVSRDLDRWWEPGFFWPREVVEPTSLDDLDAYIELFRHLGFELCDTPDLEAGWLKIALYAEGRTFFHVAKQLRSDVWSSKAGPLHDLRHTTLEVFAGFPIWRGAQPTVFMRRVDNGEDMQVEETGLILLAES